MRILGRFTPWQALLESRNALHAMGAVAIGPGLRFRRKKHLESHS